MENRSPTIRRVPILRAFDFITCFKSIFLDNICYE
nr:MAG TPA: hypothetical protein [Caudoviricetes sp.]